MRSVLDGSAVPGVINVVVPALGGDGGVREAPPGAGRRVAAQKRPPAQDAGPVFEGSGQAAKGATKYRPPRYAADLAMMHRFVTRGVRSQGGAYRLHGLKRGYEKEYAELAAEAQGQGELL